MNDSKSKLDSGAGVLAGSVLDAVVGDCWMDAALVVTCVVPLKAVSSAMEYAPPAPAELALMSTLTNSADTLLNVMVCVPPVPATPPDEVVRHVPPVAP